MNVDAVRRREHRARGLEFIREMQAQRSDQVRAKEDFVMIASKLSGWSFAELGEPLKTIAVGPLMRISHLAVYTLLLCDTLS